MIDLKEVGKKLSAKSLSMLQKAVELISELVSTPEESAVSEQPLTEAQKETLALREAMLQGSIEQTLEAVRSIIDLKQNQSMFCNCIEGEEYKDRSYSSLRIEGTFQDGRVAVSCYKCSGWWMANWRRDEQGKIQITNVKPAAQVVVTLEAKKDVGDSNDPGEISISEAGISLSESGTMDENGIIKDVCIITPGWGISGYYPKTVLTKEASGFAGLQMFVDHPTSTEEQTRPERSVKELAATLVNSVYKESGWKGPGVYGDVKVFSEFQAPIKEKAPYIGLSIYGKGKAKLGTAEGRTGMIVESIPIKRSVDFVTLAGAGGALMPILESARGSAGGITVGQRSQAILNPLKEGQNNVNDEELKQLKETVTGLVAEVGAVKTENLNLKEANRKLTEKDMIREAGTVVDNLLADPAVKLVNLTKSRIRETRVMNIPVTSDGQLDKVKLAEAIKADITTAEAEYAALTGSGRVVGMGGETPTPTTVRESAGKDMADMFGIRETTPASS